ncbi:MAG: hypothetical protein HY323_05535 [Betaproteobacteria bacterium]|nr:hypothetical protein [Betaproteobacteria bacterium]
MPEKLAPPRESADLYAPLSEFERKLAHRLGLNPLEWPQQWWAAIRGRLEVDPPKTLVSDISNLRGEEWREVGASGQPAFGTNWGNYGTPWETAAFYKDPLGRVYLKGMTTKTGTPTINDVIFTLPEGYRPAKDLLFGVASETTGTFGASRVDVKANGDVVWIAGGTSETDYTQLNNISFRAA